MFCSSRPCSWFFIGVTGKLKRTRSRKLQANLLHLIYMHLFSSTHVFFPIPFETCKIRLRSIVYCIICICICISEATATEQKASPAASSVTVTD
ncbi:hypothetical protein BDW62DRAFT_81624 [Aspergillus aurantiobrunneus]